MELKGFKNPESILRPAPFWAINDRVTSEEIARQMADMISVGLSGGFFHSRHGLITDYLSDEWFSAMNAALDVAKKNDGYLWLYDEDLWPSGNAGGQVAGMKDEYRSTILDAVLVAEGEPAPTVTEDQAIRYCYAIKNRKGLQLKDFEAVPLDKLDDFVGYERLFLVRTYTPKIGWWGGESYANLLHPEAMKQFVSMTHEVYAKKLGSEFGKRIPGIFTDEPQVANSPTGFAWYEGIPEKYSEWNGRDFWADLPYLYFEGPQSRKIRQTIHRTVLRQFLEAYSKPIFEWCEAHGLEHTGHYNAEDGFGGQINCHMGGIMAHYRYQQAPGIDHLCRQIDGMLFTCKQVSSAARQLGRTRVLDEIFGVSRHTNTFEDFKWLGDYDLVMGANFFCPHLTWYSAKGRRKRDYPPVWNYQQTYWKDLNPLNDYFTRIAYALTRGKAEVPVLLLHSIESATAAHRYGVQVRGTVQNNARKCPVDAPTEDMRTAHVLDSLMRKTLYAILNAGYDCDLGDEGYIQDMGSVQGDKFVIGEMSYKVVVLPPATTWRPKTFELAKQFAANGGKVIILGELPYELDCIDAKNDWEAFSKSANVSSLACETHSVQAAIDAIMPQNFTLKGVDGSAYTNTYLQHRIDGDQEIFFIVNSDRGAARNYVLTICNAGDKPLMKWDAVAGTCEWVKGDIENGVMRYQFSLPPAGSLLLTLGGKISECVPESQSLIDIRESCLSGQIRPLPCEFNFVRKDDNVLVMDRISISFDGGKTFDIQDYDWRVRRALASKYGTSPALEWQPWVAIRKKLFDGKGGDIVLRYKFASELDKPTASVVIEDVQKGKLTVNGTSVDVTDTGWHWDHGFGKVNISSLVKKGENIIDFAVHYDFLTEVEPAYIVGSFGVEMVSPFDAKIVNEPGKLAIGSWTSQGYPFYSGNMVYKTNVNIKSAEGKRHLLRLVRPSGVLYKVRVNGNDAGEILWHPLVLELTPLLKDGNNTLEIEVVSSLKNCWGPMHETIGDDNSWCGPNAFEDDNILREEYSIFNYGLLGGAEIVTV